MGKESKFEREFKQDIKELGGLCVKVISAEAGWMDRCVLMPKGHTFWAEVKRPDGRGITSQLQIYQKKKLTRLGHDVWIIDSEATKQNFLKHVVQTIQIPRLH